MDITTPQFLDQNATRAYPVSSSCSRVASDGQSLPDSLLVGAVINAVPASPFGTFHISGVVLSPTLVSITISRLVGSVISEIATVSANPVTHVRNDSYDFVGGSGSPGTLGILILGDLKDALSKASGVLTFPIGTARIEMSVVRISRPYISSVTLIEAGVPTSVLTGDISLTSGRNIRLTMQEDGSIRIDAISGEGMSACDDLPRCISQINGVSPTSTGEITLLGSECVAITTNTATNSLAIAESCSTPCCGCSEQANLAEALRRLNLQYNAVRDLAYRLSSESAQMVANLVAHLSNG